MAKHRSISRAQQAALAEQIAKIKQLQEQLVGIRNDLNALITSLLMYFPLPHLVDLFFTRLPILPIYNTLRTHAFKQFKESLSIYLPTVLKLEPSWKSLPKAYYRQVAQLLNNTKQLTYETTPAFITNIAQQRETNMVLLNTKDQPLGQENFTMVLVRMSTTVIHLFNRSQQKFFLLPWIIIVRFLTFFVKLYGVDWLVNRYFPLGIIPIARYVSYVPPEQLNFREAGELEQQLLKAVNDYSWLDLLEGVIAIVYLIIYTLFATHRIYNLVGPNKDMQELDLYNTCLAPTFVTMFIIAGRRSLIAVKQCWQSFLFNRHLDSRLKSLRILTDELLEVLTFSWETDSDGNKLETSRYILKLNSELKFKNNKKLKRKYFIEAIEHILKGRIPILSISSDKIVFPANYTTSDATLYNAADFLRKYCDALVELNLHRNAIRDQITKLFSLKNYIHFIANRINAEGLPVLALSIPKTTWQIFHDNGVELKSIDDNLLGCRVDLSEPLSTGVFSALKKAFKQQSSKQLLPAATADDSSRTRVAVLRRRGSKHRYAPNIVCPVPAAHFEARWPKTGDVFVAGQADRSTVSAMWGRIIPNDCFFAKYNGQIRDEGLEKTFKTKITNGRVVPPTANEGIVVNLENRLVEDPNTKERFEPDWKVKLMGTYGMYRLFGRTVDTVIVDGVRRHLVEFNACVLTHK